MECHSRNYQYDECFAGPLKKPQLVGCMVDNPDDGDRSIDPTPQFDKEGNPNFDTHGNYQGCHGAGCLVDDPDDADTDDN